MTCGSGEKRFRKGTGFGICIHERVGRSPKWTRVYTGPYLITNVLNSIVYEIQRSRKARKQIVHVDKLKLFEGDEPVAWLDEPTGESETVVMEGPIIPSWLEKDNPLIVEAESAEGEAMLSMGGTTTPLEQGPDETTPQSKQPPAVNQRPTRQRGRPQHLKDFLCRRIKADRMKITKRCRRPRRYETRDMTDNGRYDKSLSTNKLVNINHLLKDCNVKIVSFHRPTKMAMSKEDHDNFQRRERERSRTISAKRIKSSNLIDWAMFKVDENSFRCPICNAKRESKNALQQHFGRQHNDKRAEVMDMIERKDEVRGNPRQPFSSPSRDEIENEIVEKARRISEAVFSQPHTGGHDADPELDTALRIFVEYPRNNDELSGRRVMMETDEKSLSAKSQLKLDTSKGSRATDVNGTPSAPPSHQTPESSRTPTGEATKGGHQEPKDRSRSPLRMKKDRSTRSTSSTPKTTRGIDEVPFREESQSRLDKSERCRKTDEKGTHSVLPQPQTSESSRKPVEKTTKEGCQLAKDRSSTSKSASRKATSVTDELLSSEGSRVELNTSAKKPMTDEKGKLSASPHLSINEVARTPTGETTGDDDQGPKDLSGSTASSEKQSLATNEPEMDETRTEIDKEKPEKESRNTMDISAFSLMTDTTGVLSEPSFQSQEQSGSSTRQDMDEETDRSEGCQMISSQIQGSNHVACTRMSNRLSRVEQTLDIRPISCCEANPLKICTDPTAIDIGYDFEEMERNSDTSSTCRKKIVGNDLATRGEISLLDDDEIWDAVGHGPRWLKTSPKLTNSEKSNFRLALEVCRPAHLEEKEIHSQMTIARLCKVVDYECDIELAEHTYWRSKTEMATRWILEVMETDRPERGEFVRMMETRCNSLRLSARDLRVILFTVLQIMPGTPPTVFSRALRTTDGRSLSPKPSRSSSSSNGSRKSNLSPRK